MKFTDQIIYTSFDLKLFIIILLSFLIINLILIMINHKFKILKGNKILFVAILFITLISLGLGYYFSYSKENIVPNKYYDNQFETLYTNKYINARLFKSIGFEYSDDSISRNAITIERNSDNEEFIVKYKIGDIIDEYLFTNYAPLIKENEIYKGFEAIYYKENYGTTLDIDMTFDTAKTKTKKIELEVYSLDGEKLEQGEIVFYKNSVSYQ